MQKHFLKRKQMYKNISFWNIKQTVLYSIISVIWATQHRKVSVKRPTVYIRVGQEVSQLFAFSVVVQHPETLVTEETWATRSKLVVCSEPPGESRGDVKWSLQFEKKKKTSIHSFYFYYKPPDEDVTHGTFLRGDPVLVCEKWIQLLVQTVIPVGQSAAWRQGRKEDRSIPSKRAENTALSYIRDIKSSFNEWLPCSHQR